MADFVLGRLKFKWRGDWAVSTAYLIDDIVKYGGNTYVVTANHTSQSTIANFYTDLSAGKYSLHSESLFFKGNWAGSTFYKLNDLVKNGAFQYRCILQHTSASTFAIGSNWQVFTEGLQFEDSYDASTEYQDGDVVTYGGYTYVYVNSTPSSGNTPTDNSYWDVVTTGFKALGDYSHGTAYKTGDTVKYGGNNYVATANHTNQYPANTNGTTNTSYWTLNLEGFNYRASYDAATIYNIGDVVRLTATTYVAIQDRIQNVSPDSDAAKWQVMAQGDTGSVLSTRGDLIKQGAAATERLPIGTVGSVLTTDGQDPIWSNAEGKNVYYVANSGSDSNPGSQYLPFKTINYALSQATSGDVVEFDTITGGTGGTPGTYDIAQSSSDGSGTGVTARVILDGSSTPSFILTSGGSGHAAGDIITFSDTASQLAGASNITITVVSASVGDVVYIKNGVYREILPLRVPTGVTVQGESLRGTEIRPASGNSKQIKTIDTIAGGTGGTPGTYNHVHQSASTQSGDGIVVNVTTDGSSTPSVTIYHGGFNYTAAETITIPGSSLGGSSDLTFNVASFETNNSANMFLLNNATNIVQMSMKGLTGTPTAGGTGKAAVTSLDPSGSITTTSPYVQNCSSVNAGATGIQIDGNLHSAGNKSILANDFTQINSDGIGVHCLAGGRGEMVSIFTYYCDKSFYAHSGGFIRGLNCSSAYGEKGAVAEGTLSSETVVGVQTRGELLKYDATSFVGAATESDIANTVATGGSPTAASVTGDTSGATATIFRTNISLDHIHIENRSGNFTQGETVTITKDDSSTYQVNLDSSTGDSTAGQIGQIGPLIAVSSGTTSLTSTGLIKVGTNIKFAGDSKYYRVSLASEENTTNETATVRLTESITTANAKADNTVGEVTEKFSNVRLTGHDFLDIGTGDFTTSNYPGGPTQPASQEDEVEELTGGRVYFSSTDQKGDFRVGDLFRIEQATGIATLNADAFDLSGLTELQLGSIGAELGATINEFSTDETLSGDANSAVPTERAIVGYTQRDKMGTGHLVPPTGTTSQRPTGSSLFTGGIRYNSTLVTWEGYNGTQWTGLGGGNPWATHTSDGSTYLTVAANDRYFIDTTAGAQIVNLPASPQSGDQVSFIDLKGTFDTNNLTISRNGKKIMGLSEDLVITQENAGLQLVFTNDTDGWRLINN